MSEKITLSTWYGRPLTRTEIRVFTFVEDQPTREELLLAIEAAESELADYGMTREAANIITIFR